MGHLRGSLKHLSMDWRVFFGPEKGPHSFTNTVSPKVRGYDLWGPSFGGHSKLSFHFAVWVRQGTLDWTWLLAVEVWLRSRRTLDMAAGGRRLTAR